MQLCCQMCDIARVCSHPLTHRMHIKARFPPTEHLHSRFQQLLSSDGSSLALTARERVLDWSIVGRRESLTDVEITDPFRDRCSKNSLTTQEKPNLHPEDVFQSICMCRYRPKLPGSPLTFPELSRWLPTPESSFLCMTHIGMWRASSIQDRANVGYTPGT